MIQIIFKVYDIIIASVKKILHTALLPSKHGTVLEDIPSCSCTVLYDPPHEQLIKADIVFVHGFLGSSQYTWRQGQSSKINYRFWTERNGSQLNAPENAVKVEELKEMVKEKKFGQEQGVEPATCWPRDWLPEDLPGVRVLALDYSTDPHMVYYKFSKNLHRRKDLPERSREMTKLLQMKGVGSRPIVWCAHSKGGLYIKQILVNIAQQKESEAATILDNTRGFMFMSVPHHGTWLAALDNIFSLIPLSFSLDISEMGSDNLKLEKLHEEFLSLYGSRIPNIPVISTVETVPAWIGPLRTTTIPMSSADVGFGPFLAIETQHLEVCKPISRNCIIYQSFLALARKALSL